MNNKKYQVFISSTYTDLIEERRKVVDAVLMANCIPTGMEAFVASDESQFEVIKKVIDLCDYYILIIAHRYGSIFPMKDISYTEMEYEYALEQKIPVLAFIIDDSVEVDDSKKENSELLRAKLKVFKEKVSKNRMVSFWKTKDELFGQVIASLYNSFSLFNRPGWTRGGSFDEGKLLIEIQSLKDENEQLKSQIKNSSTALQNNYESIEFPMHYSETVYFYTSGMTIKKKDINPTLGELFKHVSVSLTSDCTYDDFCKAVNNFVPGYHTDDTTIKKLKGQLLIFELVDEHTKIVNKKNELLIHLTDYGYSEMRRLIKGK